MLSSNVEIIDIAPDQYERVMKLLNPPRGVRGAGLILFYSGSRLLHAVHTRKGPGVPVQFFGPQRLNELAAQHDADWVVCLERNAIKRLAAATQSGIDFADPFTAQGQTLLRALGAELGAGIHAWPDPAPALNQIKSGIPAIISKLTCKKFVLAAFVFDDYEGLWASLILEFRDNEIVFISTSDLLEPLDLSGKSMEQRVALLLGRCAERRGPAHLGLFCDRHAFMHIVCHPSPARALAQCVRNGWVTLGPCPWRMRLAIRLLPRILRNKTKR